MLQYATRSLRAGAFSDCTRYLLGYRSVSGGYNYKISENYSTDRTRPTHTNHGHGKNGQLVARGACSRLWHHSATVSGSWVDPVDL